jgi:hypothetical protein
MGVAYPQNGSRREEIKNMVAAISLASMLSGAALAYFAPQVQGRTELLERCAGVLLIAGLSLIGSGLRLYC